MFDSEIKKEIKLRHCSYTVLLEPSLLFCIPRNTETFLDLVEHFSKWKALDIIEIKELGTIETKY